MAFRDSVPKISAVLSDGCVAGRGDQLFFLTSGFFCFFLHFNES